MSTDDGHRLLPFRPAPARSAAAARTRAHVFLEWRDAISGADALEQIAEAAVFSGWTEEAAMNLRILESDLEEVGRCPDLWVAPHFRMSDQQDVMGHHVVHRDQIVVLAHDEPRAHGDADACAGRREQRVRAVALRRDRSGSENRLESLGVTMSECESPMHRTGEQQPAADAEQSVRAPEGKIQGSHVAHRSDSHL